MSSQGVKIEDAAQKAITVPPPVKVEPQDFELRLTVEKDAATGEAIYKAINRETGEIVRQLPTREVLELKKNRMIEAGMIVKTTA